MWTAIAMWVGGGCTLIAAVVLPGPTGENKGALEVLAAWCLFAAAFSFAVFPRLSNRALYVATNCFSALGAVTIFLACRWSGGADSGLAELYFFPVLYDAYFFRGRDVAWQVALNSALAISPLLYSGAIDQSQFPGHAMVLVATFWVLSIVICAYRRRMLEAEAASRRLALSDPLTGLHNVRSLEEQAAALSDGCALLMIDLNDFKDVNSRHGHLGADRVLQAVAAGLLDVTRDSDCVARAGGDEFAVLSRGRSFHEIEQLRTACAGAVRDATVRAGVGGAELAAGIGVATWPRDGRDLTHLMQTADRAMYAQKAALKRRDGARLPTHLAPASTEPAAAKPPRDARPVPVPVLAWLGERAAVVAKRLPAGLVAWVRSCPTQGTMTAATWFGGAMITSVAVLLPGAASTHRMAVELLAAAAVAGTPLVLLGSRARPAATFAASDALATSSLTLAVYLSGGTTSPLLPVVFLAVTASAYFFPPKRMAVTVVSCIGVFATPFVYAPGGTLGTYVVRFVTLATTATVLAAILAYNRRQLVSAQQTAEELAEHDALTGLPNRRAFFSRLAERLGDAREESRQLAVAIIDLDNFKTVNDRHGHGAGDAVLRAIAASLRDVVRCEDCVARIGGDEFALVASGAEAELTRTLGLRCIEAAQDAAVLAGGGDCGVSATVGFATYPDHADDPDGLMAVADRALMEAKDAGKRRVAAPEWTEAAAG